MKKKGVAILSVAATLAVIGAGVGTVAALKHNNVRMPWDNLLLGDDAVFGIDRNEDGDFVRTGDARGLRFGINGAANDFDKVGPWAKIKTVHYGDEVAVRIPKFYQNSKGTSISLTKQDSTWTVNAAFLDKDGKEKDYFDYGAYAVDVDKDGVAHSREGAIVTPGLSLEAYRAAAKKTFKSTSDSQAYVSTYAEYSAIIQLMSIEFGTTQIEKTLNGVRANMYQQIDEDIQQKGDKNVVYVADKGQFAVGMPFEFCTGSYRGYVAEKKILAHGTIKSIKRKTLTVEVAQSSTEASSSEASSTSESAEPETEDVKVWAIELDCDEIDVAAALAAERRNDNNNTAFLISVAHETGHVNNNGKGSIRLAERMTDADVDTSAKFRQEFSYRGIENVYGVYLQWVDGFTTLLQQDGSVDVMYCLDPAKFANADHEATAAAGWKTLINIPQAELDNYSGKFWTGANVENGFILPDTTDSPNYTGQSGFMPGTLGKGQVYINATGGFRAFLVGCSCSSGGACNGAFYLNGVDPSDAYDNSAARLSFR